jgi:uncharacterized membrane protein
MVAPFADFAVPSTLYLAFLLAGSALLAALLYAVQPPLTQRTVLAMVPWIVSGAILHVFYQIGEAFQVQLYPRWIEPLFAAPAVYLTTFLAMGTAWLVVTVIGVESAAVTRDRVAGYLAGVGLGILIPLLGLLAWQAADPAIGPLEVVLPVAGLLLSLAVTFVVYVLLGAWRTYIIAEARHVGALLLFAHVFDGITTAIGVDLLGTGERSVLPRMIMDFARDLPIYEVLGSGWLFVVVKVLVAVLVIVVFADYLSERPRRGNLFFAAITVVGLGPALNNFFLFVLGLA